MTVFLICLATVFVSAVVSAVATFLFVDHQYKRRLEKEMGVIADGLERISFDLERQ